MSSSNIAQQVDDLKSKFPKGSLKIIENQGEYQYVIRLELLEAEIHVRVYIPKELENQPFVMVSSTMGQNFEVAMRLQEFLSSKISHSLNLEEFFKAAEDFLNSQEFGASSSKIEKSKAPRKKSLEADRLKNESKVEEEPKNSYMKSASDVINRIRWDDELKKHLEYFTVGYLDRFVGILEASIKEFEGKDFATADPDDFAIPEHRIQYFKYKTEKVWDKKEKLDFIFGSTGATKTIFDVMQEVDSREP